MITAEKPDILESAVRRFVSWLQSALVKPLMRQEASPPNRTRTCLKWMNAVLVILLGVGLVQGLEHTWPAVCRIPGLWLAVNALLCFVFASYLLGFLAARAPEHERTRKIAKWLNLATLAFVSFALLRGAIDRRARITTDDVGWEIVSDLIAKSFLVVPALANVLMFWKGASTTKPSKLVGIGQEREGADRNDDLISEFDI